MKCAKETGINARHKLAKSLNEVIVLVESEYSLRDCVRRGVWQSFCMMQERKSVVNSVESINNFKKLDNLCRYRYMRSNAVRALRQGA